MKQIFHNILRLTAAAVAVVAMFSVSLAAAGNNFTVAIDPGHGAHDAGAVGVVTTEKAINLAVANKLAALIRSGMKDTKVIMTRDDDTFVPLQGRADIANAGKADVFISIHANSIDKKAKNRTTIRGAAVYTLGLDRSDTNLAVAMRENEVMKLEKDYSTTYAGFDPSSTESYIMFDLIQHSTLNSAISLASEVQKELVNTAGRKNNGVKQAPFWVLVRTSMPAILVELDFICNPEMEQFMASESGQERLAQAIYNGLRNYRNLTGASIPPKSEQPTSDEPNRTNRTNKTNKSDSSDRSGISAAPEYRIQFLTCGSPLDEGSKELGGISGAEYYIDGGVCKYTYGHYPTTSAASGDLKRIRKKFPGAFIVKMQGNKRLR